MYLGRVVGSCVAERKSEGLRGQRMLMVQPLCREKKPNGRLLVAIDTVRSGPGDLVYLVASREAAQALEQDFGPVDAAIVGIVDDFYDAERP